MVNRAKLKKEWTCPRGKIYPAGTTFKISSRIGELNLGVYEFIIPGKSTGSVVFSDKIFKQLTKEELDLKRLRDELREEHIRKAKEAIGI